MKDLGDFDYGREPSGMSLGKKEIRPITKLYNGDLYKGEWLIDSNVREGRGYIKVKDGSIYEGWFKDNKKHGFGRYIFYNGDSYEG